MRFNGNDDPNSGVNLRSGESCEYIAHWVGYERGDGTYTFSISGTDSGGSPSSFSCTMGCETDEHGSKVVKGSCDLQ